MKYIANPVEVEAFKIVKVHTTHQTEPVDGMIHVYELENGEKVQPTEAMMSRMIPVVGDYWVIRSDGYIYLNPKDVFECNYRPA